MKKAVIGGFEKSPPENIWRLNCDCDKASTLTEPDTMEAIPSDFKTEFRLHSVSYGHYCKCKVEDPSIGMVRSKKELNVDLLLMKPRK